jgi:hypothetical protein
MASKMKWSFDRALAIGDLGQEIVRRDLIADGWLVIRLHDMAPADGHGPRIDTDGQGITLPDLHATKHGYTLAPEIKTKTELTFGLITGQPEHGIDGHCYDEMREYERRTGVKVFLVVVEVFRVDHVPEEAEWEEGIRMCTTTRSRYVRWCLEADNDVDREECLEKLRASVHAVNGVRALAISQLGVRPNGDMVYFPRGQLRPDWLATLNRHVIAKDRGRAKRARESDDI